MSSKKISYRGKVKILDENYVFKEKTKDIKYLYDYLSSRDFYNYPELIDETIDSYKFKYINKTKETNIQDVLEVMANLHSKTAYYKEIKVSKIEEIYKNILDNINYLKKYYEDMILRIEKNNYFSPSEYLIARNISFIFSSMKYSEKLLDEWKKKALESNNTRIVLVHNNLEKNHVIIEEEKYIISFDNYIKDSPVMDIIKFYKNENYNIKIIKNIGFYENIFKLNEEENLLFCILISMPLKMVYGSNEIDNIICSRVVINTLFEVEKIVKNRYNLNQNKTTV